MTAHIPELRTGATPGPNQESSELNLPRQCPGADQGPSGFDFSAASDDTAGEHFDTARNADTDDPREHATADPRQETANITDTTANSDSGTLPGANQGVSDEPDDHSDYTNNADAETSTDNEEEPHKPSWASQTDSDDNANDPTKVARSPASSNVLEMSATTPPRPPPHSSTSTVTTPNADDDFAKATRSPASSGTPHATVTTPQRPHLRLSTPVRRRLESMSP